MAYLQLQDIHKSYQVDHQEFHVLNGINLAFERGEFVSILGESGGGKTTLMNIIAGLDSQYTGDVLLNGKSLKRDTAKELDQYRRSTIGFVFQSFNLISHLTIRDNVLVSLEMTNLSHHEQLQRADHLLDQVGLSDHKNKYPNQLSGGQKQRVSIARALASDPDIIIADEPTGALDAENTDEILQLLNQIAKDGKLVIAVTHSQVVANYGTRIVHLANGLIDDDRVLKPAYPVENTQKPFRDKVASSRSMATMAWHHFRYNLKRNLLIMFGAAIGIFSVILMLGLGNGTKGYINHEIYSQINPNTIQVAKNVNADNPTPKETRLTTHDQKRLANIAGVKHVAPGYFATGGGQLKSGQQTVTLSLLQTFDNTLRKSSIKAGHAPKQNEILISKKEAKQLNKNHPNQVVGQKVTLYLNIANDQTQAPQVLQQEVTISGVADSNNLPDAVSYGTLKAMHQAANVPFGPNYLAVDITGGVQNVQPVQNKIKALDNSKHKQAYQITGAGSIVSILNTYVNLAVAVLTSIAAISLLVSAIMIIVVLYISVSERTKEIGILRALGFSKGNIRKLFIFEAVFLGFFSALFAIVLAYLVEWGVDSLSQSGIHYHIMQISVGNAIFGLAISVIICLLAALLPARKAAKVDPIVSLSAE
ncbi:ATP-binding cassette domain-containing protein [Fructilactobacillus myrtifloralis]|uniref:ATP-binding cassette domain-containing protein n=1 Tax=Fructilactobacillus myrtifloralis TaxID=2940301 RepID=A0ABY5BMV6_9LACO|nr:ABC transporter ATP-binding protein/permease [Fructilactobacillus myrtifloralis]USS84932.1 ATP-binding cassette domain-containing protein [Fructilactobacillus myrtifloralis]